jgi:HSP20 family protein
MHRGTYDLMHDQVRAIFRAVTGSDLPSEPTQALSGQPEVPEQAIYQRFAEVETLARLIPAVAERVPPFAFTPPMDVIEREKELVVELAVPGIAEEDVQVQLHRGLLVVSGTRSSGKLTNGHVYWHAEIPRGPFRRVVTLPQPVSGQSRIEIRDGIIRIHLSKGTVAKA